jgi:sulfate permease, SulP family
LQYLPVCVLGSVVFTIAVQLIDFKGMGDLKSKAWNEWLVAMGTAACVVVLGVEQGILIAIAISLMDHIRQSYRPHTAIEVADEHGNWCWQPVANAVQAEPGLMVYWFGATLYYANVNHCCEQALALVNQARQPVKWLVIDAGAIAYVDYSAAGSLADLHDQLSKQGVSLAFVHVSADLRADFERMHLTEKFRAELIFDRLRECVEAYRNTA